jgi:drug/metabolite transporter (DMT)-like permease
MTTIAAGHKRRTQGILLMTAAGLAVQVVDGIAKHLSADYSPLFIGWARYATASLVLLPCVARIHGARIFPAERLGSHVLRTVFMVAAMTLYFLAIAHVPLATAISAYLVGPVMAVVLSIFLVGERPGRRARACCSASAAPW